MADNTFFACTCIVNFSIYKVSAPINGDSNLFLGHAFKKLDLIFMSTLDTSVKIMSKGKIRGIIRLIDEQGMTF